MTAEVFPKLVPKVVGGQQCQASIGLRTTLVLFETKYLDRKSGVSRCSSDLDTPLIMSSSAVGRGQQQESARPATNSSSISASLHPQQLSVPLPLTPHTTLHMQITPLETSTMVFLTTTDQPSSSSLSALGSFVYSMPNVCLP